jgi:syntaxin 18
MTDITKTFRALIKAKQVSADIPVNSSKRTKKNEHTSTRFLSQAKLILKDILKLKQLLIDSRTNYLSPSYLLSTTNRIMTDWQRVDFEQQIEQQIKQCRDELDKLKTSIGQISFSGQRRSHYELVGAYLERDLVQSTKIYSEQKCLINASPRERRSADSITVSSNFSYMHRRIDRRRTSTSLSTMSTSARRGTCRTWSDSSRARFRFPSQRMSIVTSHQIDHSDDAEHEHETHVQPVGNELRQLQHENKQLYHDVAQRSEEIRGISSQVVEIAQLQNELFDNILIQKDVIEQVDGSAVASNDDLAAAIIHIRDAIRNTAQMRRWVIFFLLVMIFSLLFLDWYNV